jgi:hypothetical protein
VVQAAELVLLRLMAQTEPQTRATVDKVVNQILLILLRAAMAAPVS